MVLGEMVETNYHRALMLSGGSYSIFFSSIICKILVILIILSFTGPYLAPLWKRWTGRKK